MYQRKHVQYLISGLNIRLYSCCFFLVVLVYSTPPYEPPMPISTKMEDNGGLRRSGSIPREELLAAARWERAGLNHHRFQMPKMEVLGEDRDP